MDTENYAVYINEINPVINKVNKIRYVSEKRNIFIPFYAYFNKIAVLREKNQELRKVNENQKRIISILAHDVRNPLLSIKNIIELRQTDILDANSACKMMQIAKEHLNNTIEMVDNIVQWGQSRLFSGEINYEDIDLHALVKNVFLSESLKALVKNNSLCNNISQGTNIHSDKQALEFILRNLISNANKFTENGCIIVNVQQQGRKTALLVSDTGVGMSDDQIKKLFNNPKNGSTLGTRLEKGSGLGLLLVKESIGHLGGSIAVESLVNQGTCFKIVI